MLRGWGLTTFEFRAMLPQIQIVIWGGGGGGLSLHWGVLIRSVHPLLSVSPMSLDPLGTSIYHWYVLRGHGLWLWS